MLDGAESPRARLRLPAGAYAVTLNAAAVREPADATALLPRVAEPSPRWLALPATEVVLVAPGRTTRARVDVASTAPLAGAWQR
ncbi:MAG TPA: hypothetical protein VJU61_11865 [Polyangiaceae bacterium]|nr:hypothetical protein [Polyangiaceae bacterium]